MVSVKLKPNNSMKRSIIILLILLNSCVFIRMDDSIDLGSNYRYIQDYPQTIIYHLSERYEGGGETVVEPIVLSYNCNDKYIIVKSQEHVVIREEGEEKPFLYWIIDKTNGPENVKPMDSLSFYNQLEYFNIDLGFKKN